jgi:hypothetical protein
MRLLFHVFFAGRIQPTFSSSSPILPLDDDDTLKVVACQHFSLEKSWIDIFWEKVLPTNPVPWAARGRSIRPAMAALRLVAARGSRATQTLGFAREASGEHGKARQRIAPAPARVKRDELGLTARKCGTAGGLG